MPKRQSDDPEPEHLDRIHDAGAHPDPHQVGRTTVTPMEGETTRVMLTDDNRVILTERYIPSVEYGFRIYVDGQHFEQIGVVPDSGTTVFAPTR